MFKTILDINVKHCPLYSIANFMIARKRDTNFLQSYILYIKELILGSANKGFG